MHLLNTPQRYGIIAIFIHWVMALLLIFLVSVGLYMVNLPVGLLKLKLFGWHKECGMLVLMLVILRIVWRNTNPTPSLNHLPWWEKGGALTVHYCFYVLMIALPLTGWLITSAAGLPVSFFGLFVIPTIIPPSDFYRHLFHMIHRYSAYALIALGAIHIAAAFKHHFIDRDDILRRMIS